MDKKYIRFELLEQKEKTSVHDVINITGNYSLGIIKWNSSWRQYCFYPLGDTVFSKGCLNDINNFIGQLMNQRKILRQRTQVKPKSWREV